MGAFSGDRIVLDGAGSLRAPVGVVGNLPDAEAVLLFSQVGFLRSSNISRIGVLQCPREWTPECRSDRMKG
jgi:hypothetical protein